MKSAMELLNSGVYITLQVLRVISVYMIVLSVLFFLQHAGAVALIYLLLTNVILDLAYDC